MSIEITQAFERHQRVAFQFSGGRDSVAALYLLRRFWGLMTVYHLDSGDQFPETQQVFKAVAADYKKVTGQDFVVLHGDVQSVREKFGLASDLVPVDNMEVGRMVSGSPVKIINRYECCVRTLMLPMNQRMIADGITLLIRGQRDDDYVTPPRRSAQVADGFEFLYPIQSWNADQVDAFLTEHCLPVAPFYAAGLKGSPECMGCTAWWNDGRAGYMKQHHPQEHRMVMQKMSVIRDVVNQQYAFLNDWSHDGETQ